MYERKSKDEYYMMLQITRIMMLSSAKFNALCENLDRSKLQEISTALEEARGSVKQI